MGVGFIPWYPKMSYTFDTQYLINSLYSKAFVAIAVHIRLSAPLATQLRIVFLDTPRCCMHLEGVG